VIIFLIGLPGCGKTTLGRAINAATGLPFTDLDEAIEAAANCSISEIFKIHGEPAFRSMEHDILASLCTGGTGIVACGGGTACSAENIKLMQANGCIVWLQAQRDIVLRRLCEARRQRPLIANLNDEEIAKWLDDKTDARRPFYSQASRIFDSSRLDTADEIAETVAKFREEFNL
jgi:shikimate kinase